MSHAELRESFTAASAAQHLGAAEGGSDGTHRPSMGVSPHTQRREAALLSGTASDTLAVNAAAIQESVQATQKATEAVERIASGGIGSGGEGGSTMGSSPGAAVGVAAKNTSFASTPGGTAGQLLGHAALRESFSSGGAAATAAAAAVAGGGNASFGASPPSLNPVFSPHRDRREQAAAAAAATASTVASQLASKRGTPTTRGIVPQPSAVGGNPFDAFARGGVSAGHAVTPAGPLGGGGSTTNTSFAGSLPRSTAGLLSHPQGFGGVSPFADPNRGSLAASFAARNGDSLTGLATATATAMTTHNELREGLTVATSVVSSGDGSGSNAKGGGGGGDLRNVSFGTTPHTELREGGALLGASFSDSSRLTGSFALRGGSGEQNNHNTLRESFTSGGGPAAAAAAAAIEKEKALQKARDERSPLFGVSPNVAPPATTTGGGIGLHGIVGSTPATMGSSLTAHTALRESFAGPAAGQQHPGSPGSASGGTGNVYGSPNPAMSASVDSSHSSGVLGIASRPSLTVPTRGATRTVASNRAEYGERAESGGHATYAALRSGWSASAGVGGSSAPTHYQSHHQQHRLHYPQHHNPAGGMTPPMGSSVEPRTNPHAQQREASTRKSSVDSVAGLVTAAGVAATTAGSATPATTQPPPPAHPSTTEYAT